MRFKAKAVSGSQTAYIQNSKKDTNRIQIKELSTEWKDYQCTLTVDSTGYLGFYINGGNGIEIKELQVELGNEKTNYEEFKYTLQSNYSINLEDRKNEITSNDYYIKIYEDNNLITTDRYEEIPEENVITNAIKTYETQSGKQYKVELVIKINDREYVLSELEYNTQDSEEIKGIYNKEDFLEIQPRGHYIVLGDIDVRGGSGNQYTFGSSNMRFEGTIDFNGYSVLKDTSTLSRTIEYIGESGLIKNIEFKIYLNNQVEITTFEGFFYVNYGKIENVMVSLEECSRNNNVTIDLFGKTNYGEISNFIVNYKTPLYVMAGARGFIFQNYGTVKNGYVYGAGIEQISARGDKSNLSFAHICNINFSSGIIENIYTVANIKIVANSTDYKNIGNIVVENNENSTVKNVYSVDIDDSITDLTHGPNVYITNNKTENLYYFDDKIFNNSNELKSTKLALKDVEFQNQILNSDGAFNIQETIEKGYYPHLNMPKCMPTQEYIELPEVEDADLADILSTEVLEQGSNTVRVKFVVNNPSAETITNIKIKDLNCEIESQEYKGGKSEVIAILNNPITCKSSYSVLSITTKGAFNLAYTRKFEENERIIKVELFREIRTVDDWIAINKSPTENYMLMEDIDFINQSDNVRIGTEFQGVLEGNNHTINNVNVNNYLIYNATKADIRNIIIKNVNINMNTAVAGLIRRNDGATLENIQIINENITTESITNDTTIDIGGLCGEVYDYAVIKNCSISNLNIINNFADSSSRIGGLIGVSSYSEIRNSFVQDINIEETNNLNTIGIGGIAGSLGTSKASIANCYAVGKINNLEGSIGGIVGRGENVEIYRCISNVNISSSGNDIGGIAGKIERTVNSYSNIVENNLVLGNLYTSAGIEGVKRIKGNKDDTENNFAYENQRINGEISTEALGGKLISYEEIFNENTYNQKINLQNQYDLSGLKSNILPKLRDTEGNLLPNQKDNTLEENKLLEIESIEAQKTGENTLTARINVENPSNLQITNLTIDGMDVEIVRNINEKGKTYIDINTVVTKYYDSYKIEKLEYLDSSEDTKEIDVEGIIDLQYFKNIYSFDDWQNIDTESYQNYRIMADIDFNNRSDVKKNLLINRLETDGQIRTLKNITLTFDSPYSGLIKKLKGNLTNIRLENIKIDATKNNVNYIGIIAISNGDIENIELKDITIEAKGGYVGFIASSEGDNMKNVTADNINIDCNNSYVGSIAGQIYTPIGENITATNVNIKSNSDNIGGLFGRIYVTESKTFSGLTISNSNIQGRNYVGGICGYRPGNTTSKVINLTAKDTEVHGNNYVGGIGGYIIESYNLFAENVNVNGASYVGGIAGSSASYIMHVKDSTITGTGNNVGGIAGFGDYNLQQSEIVNSKITSTGNYVGAAFGYINVNTNNMNQVYAKGCTVEGNSYVGGIAGGLKRYLQDSYTNSKVIATNHSAGGLVGYLDNANMTNAINQRRVYRNIVAGATVQGNSNVGGLIGSIAEDLYMPETYFYGNFIQADLVSNTPSTMSLGIGNKPNQTQYLADTYFYKFSTVNGENPNETNEEFIAEEKYLIADELKEQSVYTSKMRFTSNWKFTSLTSNKYPLLSSTNYKYQEGIDLPKDEEHIGGNISNNNINVDTLENNNEEPEQIFEYNNKTIQTYSTYSLITAEDGSQATRNAKLYVKDNTLYAIPSLVSANEDSEVIPVANNLILDSYNGKEYETVLGSDGKLYDLKEPITYPESFVNSEIESIGNNLNSDVKEVEVTYKNGDKIKFNYQTGEVISSSKAKDTDETGLVDYLKEKIAEIGDTSANKVSQEITTKYEESKELQTKLEETSVEEAIEKQNDNNTSIANLSESNTSEGVTTTENNVTNNSLTENKYINMYNEETGQYEIYNEEELLDTTKEEVVSENEKIEANNLSEYYASEGETKNTKMGIVWIVISIIGVGIILFVLRKNLKKKNA